MAPRRLQSANINDFFYFSKSENIDNILNFGILPKNEVIRRNIGSASFANEEVQERRHNKHIVLSDGNLYNVHDLVPFYLTPLTPTLYSRRALRDNIFFVVVPSSIVSRKRFAFSDGNATNWNTQHYTSLDELGNVPMDVIRAQYWTQFEDGARKRNSEFLIHPNVLPTEFSKIVVNEGNTEGRNTIQRAVNRYGLRIPVVMDGTYFF